MRKVYFFLSILAYFLCLNTVWATTLTGELKGMILDKKLNKPLSFTSISLEKTHFVTTSNEAGVFHFKKLPVGTYTLVASFIGFKTYTQVFEIKANELLDVTIDMEEELMQLDAVLVSSNEAHKQQLINKIDINLRPINNSQEVLRMVPGLFIGQHAGGGKAEQIFLRGFDIDHGTDIRLTVDGIPVNMVSHAHGQGYADLHFVIPELIESVNFKKGMYHADKGNFSTAGWVDFRTKETLEHSFLKLEAGQFNTYRALGGFNLLKKENQSAYIATEYNYSDSYFDSPQKFNRFNTIAKYNSKISNNSFLKITASHFQSTWNHSGQIPDRAVDSGLISFFGAIDDTEGGKTARSNINATLLTNTENGSFIKNQFFYSNYNFLLFSNFTFFLNDPINGDQIKQNENRNLFGYNGSWTKSVMLGKKNTQMSLGVQYRQDITRNSELSHTLNRNIILNRSKYGNVNEANIGIYADEEINLSPQWNLNLGVRYDHFINQYEDLLENNTKAKASAKAFYPKINLYYTPNTTFQFYLNTGKGFHSNDTRVVVAQNGEEILPAAYGSDIGMIWKPIPRLLINSALWYLWLGQEFVYVGDEGVVEPSGKTQRMGIDISTRYQIGEQLFADIDFNITRPRAIGEARGDAYLPLAPLITSIGGLTLYNKSGFNGSIRYRYMGNRPANEDYSVTAKGYFVTDFQLNYTRRKYTFGLSLYNLLNQKWKETQFNTESRLKNEAQPVEEIHFTAGSPFFAKTSFLIHF